MSVKQLTIGVLVAVCTLVAQAAAQKNELSGLIGRTFNPDQSIAGAPALDPDLRFSNGLSFEIDYARQVVAMGRGFLALSLDVPFVVNPDQDLHAALPNRIPNKYASYFVTPSARLSAFPDQAGVMADLVRVLVRGGASVNGPDGRHANPLRAAVRVGGAHRVWRDRRSVCGRVARPVGSRPAIRGARRWCAGGRATRPAAAGSGGQGRGVLGCVQGGPTGDRGVPCRRRGAHRRPR